MDTISFTESVYKDINLFRENPNSLRKRFENAKLAMSRFRVNEQVVKDIDNYLYFLNSAAGVGQVKLETRLNEIAESELDILSQSNILASDINPSDVLARLSSIVSPQVNFLIDQGAEDPGYIIGRVLFNKKDKEKKNRKILLDDRFKYVGLAHRVINDENTIFMIFTEMLPTEKIAKDKGNLHDLKQAFDLFDVNGTGKIDMKETVAAMRSLGFETKNPSLFDVMKELEIKKFVNFETFADHIINRIEDTNSEEGLRRIFDLFIDDPNSDTITLSTLKKICKELNEDVKVDQLKEMIQRASHNGNEITFKEFYDFMITKNVTES